MTKAQNPLKGMGKISVLLFCVPTFVYKHKFWFGNFTPIGNVGLVDLDSELKLGHSHGEM